jgi:DNA-binding response OmpR family regulator
MGADDYVVKPFRPRDLIARVNAVLRRARAAETMTPPPSIVRGKLKLNLASNTVQLGEKTVKLTPTECRLLYLLMNNTGQTLSSQRILQEVWGSEHKNPDMLRTHIRRIRDKLEDDPPQIILNQRGGGYRFVSPT